jgi:hypothetical protein
MGKGSIFFHSISNAVQTTLTRRQTAYSATNRGRNDNLSGVLKWGYAKEAYINLYWHCPTGAVKDKLICGTDLSKNYRKFADSTPGAYSPLYSEYKSKPKKEKDKTEEEKLEDSKKMNTPQGGSNVYFPPILLENVSITNEGRVGSLQKASGQIKCFTMKQLESLEKMILFPGADIKIEYGWTGGLGVNKCDKDTFIGIISNFGWSMNSDLSISVSFESVGKGFAVNAVPSTGLNEDNKDYAEDETNNKIFADNLASKIKADLENIKGKVKKNGFYSSNKGGYNMVYGSQTFKYDASTEIQKPKEGESVKPPDEQVITYVKLSDLLNYFNVVVLEKTRIGTGDDKLIRFSANFGINKEGINGEQESLTGEDVYMPVSISMYDPEVVSSDPASILFNDCASYTKVVSTSGNPKSGFWQIPDGSGENEYCRFKRNDNKGSNDCANDGGCNLGEILIGTNFLLNALENLSVNAKDPVDKSVQALGTEIFKKISECSGELYKLSWTEVEIKDGDKSRTWVCVTDPNFTVCDPDVWLFQIDKPNQSLVLNASISSKIPSGQQTALYVGGRSTGATDGNFTSANKVTNRELTEQCNPPKNSKKEDTPKAETGDVIESLPEARESMGKNGCTEKTRINLKASTKKYITEQKSKVNDTADSSGNSRYTFLSRDLYPLECSITLDGIAGFRFGDAVMINYVPNRYRGALCFIVTRTAHTISDNKWTTQLTLQARTHSTKPKYLNGPFTVSY